MFALVDCNNFYVSCERVFNPGLDGKPVIILSNNDGCVISRSDEAKALGIRMAEPSFLIREFLERNDVRIFSANYALYGDMSERVMATLKDSVPAIEIYSIDEAFLDLTGFDYRDPSEFILQLRKKVIRWTGIPVSIGLAPSKTLAKLANSLAKSKSCKSGTLALVTPEQIAHTLHKTPVEEIWGIGEQYGKFLAGYGIRTAWDFTLAKESWVRKHMTVMGLRTLRELKGESCIPLEMVIAGKQGIMTARSFGYEVSSKDEIREAVATFTARCAEKLRKQKSCAGKIMVFLNTNRFKPESPQYNNFEMVSLPVPTNNSMELIEYASGCLDKIFRPEYKYKKAGVFLSAIVPETQVQLHLFDTRERSKSNDMILAVDEINRIMGRDKVRFAVQGFDRKWRLRQEKLSPNYTTDWGDIPEIKI